MWVDYVEPKVAEYKAEVGSMNRRKTKKQKQRNKNNRLLSTKAEIFPKSK